MSGTSKLVENVHGAQSVVAVNVSDHGGWITCIYCMSIYMRVEINEYMFEESCGASLGQSCQ